MPGKSKLEEVIKTITKRNRVAPEDLEQFLLKRGVKSDEISMSHAKEWANNLKEQGYETVELDKIQDFLAGRTDKISSYQDPHKIYKGVYPYIYRTNPDRQDNFRSNYFENVYTMPKTSADNIPKEEKLKKFIEFGNKLFTKSGDISNFIPQLEKFHPNYDKYMDEQFGSVYRELLNEQARHLNNMDLLPQNKRTEYWSTEYKNFRNSAVERLAKEKAKIENDNTLNFRPYDYSTNMPATGHFAGPDADKYLFHVRGSDSSDRREISEIQSDVHQRSGYGYGDPVQGTYDPEDDDIAERAYNSVRTLSSRGNPDDWDEFLKNPEFRYLYAKYGKRYDVSELNNLYNVDYVQDFIEKLHLRPNSFNAPYRRLPELPFKGDKWLGRALEREIDAAMQAGKPLYIFRDVEGKPPRGLHRAQQVHDKYYAPGAEIDRQLKVIADKYGLSVEDVSEVMGQKQEAANYIKITDPKNRGKLDFYEYGRTRPETLAILGTAGLTGFGLQQFIDKKKQEEQANQAAQQVAQPQQETGPPVNPGLDQFIAQQRAAREQPEAESLSSPGIGQQVLNFGEDVLDSFNRENLGIATRNVGIDWLDALNRVQYTGSTLFGQEDPEEYARQMEYIKKLREQYPVPEGAASIPYRGLSLIAGP